MDAALHTVYEDEDWWVINKVAGMLTTTPATQSRELSLVDVAKTQRPEALHLHATSRLDRGVTGLVILAKSKWAIDAALQARRDSKYTRRYLAIALSDDQLSEDAEASGSLSAAERIARWSWAIGIDPRQPTLRVAVDTDNTKPLKGVRDAETQVQYLAARPSATLFALFPQTGRTHQLRVHAARANFPLWGDRAYGGPQRHTSSNGRVLSVRRPMLHCHHIHLKLPKREDLKLVAPVADDMRRVWEGFGGAPGDFECCLSTV